MCLLPGLHYYALFYYRRAMLLRPEDARMWCAMAQCYDLMSRKVEARDSTNLQGFTICVGGALSSYPGPKLVFMLGEALRCYEKAHRCGDRERMALPRLARLHKDLGQKRWGFVDGQQAIFVYNERTPTQEICLSRHGDPHSETHISYFDSGFDSLKESAELEGKPQLTTPRCLSRMAPAMQAYCFFELSSHESRCKSIPARRAFATLGPLHWGCGYLVWWSAIMCC